MHGIYQDFRGKWLLKMINIINWCKCFYRYNNNKNTNIKTASKIQSSIILFISESIQNSLELNFCLSSPLINTYSHVKFI